MQPGQHVNVVSGKLIVLVIYGLFALCSISLSVSFRCLKPLRAT